MASTVLSMDQYKPPPYAQLYNSQVLVLQRPPPIRYKCMYLVILIVDLIESIIAGIMIAAGIFASEELQRIVSPSESVQFGSAEFTVSAKSAASEGVRLTQVLLVFLLVVVFLIQYLGWKGYNNHSICAIYTFAITKGFGALTSLVFLIGMGEPVFLVTFILYLLFTVFPILFAVEVAKHAH